MTAEHAAINAVMAGCRADYMPVVVAAVRAHLSEKGNCHSTTGTLSGAAQAVIDQRTRAPTRLDVNCRAGCFGPGWRANATIGRALRLVIRNVCRAIPNFLDRATFSTPARYSFCFGEDEEGSDWVPMSVERGIPAGTERRHGALDDDDGLGDSTSPAAPPRACSASIAGHIRRPGRRQRRVARRRQQRDAGDGARAPAVSSSTPDGRRRRRAALCRFSALKERVRSVRIGKPEGMLHRRRRRARHGRETGSCSPISPGPSPSR